MFVLEAWLLGQILVLRTSNSADSSLTETQFPLDLAQDHIPCDIFFCPMMRKENVGNHQLGDLVLIYNHFFYFTRLKEKSFQSIRGAESQGYQNDFRLEQKYLWAGC